MMWKKISFFILAFLTAGGIICGCGGRDLDSEVQNNMLSETAAHSDEKNDSENRYYISYGNIGKEEFAAKLSAMDEENTLLVGVDTEYSEDTVRQLNQLLREEEYGFEVKFLRIPDQCCLDGAVYDFALYLKEQGVDLDVLPVWNTDLRTLAEEGLLTDLSVQLKEELCDAFPDRFWKLTSVEGENYGPGIYYAPSDGWAVNLELMEKYGFTQEDLSVDITEMEDIFRTVRDGENDPDFAAFIYNPRIFLEKIPFSCIEFTIPVGYWTDEEGDVTQAVNLFDTERMKTLVETMNRYYEEGLVKIEDDMISQDAFFMQADYNDYPVRRADSLDTWTNLSGVTLMRVPYYRQTADRVMYEINTIPSWSEKKDTAWEFLSFVYGRQEVSTLLLYGIEDQDYSIFNDTAAAGEELTEVEIYSRSLGNIQLSIPLSPYEDSSKAELIESELNALQDSPLQGFVFDTEPVQKEVDAVRELYMELSTFRKMFAFEKSMGYETWEEFYEAYNQQLKDAGIDRIVEEMNRQIQEYLKE